MSDASLPTPDEKAVFFCLVCKHREVLTTKRAVERARTQHRKETGHNETFIAWQARRKKGNAG